MAQIIYWSPPTNTNTGSVLIYRAVDNVSDDAGTRTQIDSIDAKDGSGNWVTSYSDSSGTVDNWYRIRFFDSDVGSSALSDPVSGEVTELLATFADVAQVLKLTSNSDIGSGEVYDSIQDNTDRIYSNYGDPVKVTTVLIRKPSTNSYPGSLVYDFTGDLAPVWQLKQIVVGTNEWELVSGSSYTLNARDGRVTFTQTFVDENDGSDARFYWIPKVYNTLCKNQSGLQLIEDGTVIFGGETANTRVERLERRIGSILEELRPKGLFYANQFKNYNPRGPGMVIEQEFEGQF